MLYTRSQASPLPAMLPAPASLERQDRLTADATDQIGFCADKDVAVIDLFSGPDIAYLFTASG